MALTGLSSVNGTTSAIEDKGLRDFISTASGSWTGGGGGSSPVTSTGGTTTYINKLNDKSLSASVAYASPNGALLDNVYNSGRSGYAASAYINNNVTGNVTKWNNTQTAVAGMSGVAHFYKSYNPNWWNSTASNPVSIKIYTANFCSAGGVSDAHLYLQQVQGDLSSYNITMKITGWKSNGTWTTKQFATLGSHYFSDNSLTPVFSEWTQNSRINIIPGGWDTACNCILLAGGDSAGETLRINWHGYVGG